MSVNECDLCGAVYQSDADALRCCSHLFEDDAVDEHGNVIMTDGSGIEYYPDGFSSGPDSERDPEFELASEIACHEQGCSRAAHNRCSCCGRKLCIRHNEMQGGFCTHFSTVETDEFGEIPCCPRVVGGEVIINANPGLLYPGESDKASTAMDADVVDLQEAVEAEMPDWFVRQARKHLRNVAEEVDSYCGLAINCGVAHIHLQQWQSGRDGIRDSTLEFAVEYLETASDHLTEDDLVVSHDITEALRLAQNALDLSEGER